MQTKQTWKIGDCLDVLPSIEDKSINLIIADPPYNINKADWDNIPDYLNWCMKWIKECQRVLKDNGSMYIFHSEMPTIARLMNLIEDDSDFIFKQFITWNKRFKGSKNKGFLDGFIEVEDLRNYQQMTEYILFYTFQDSTGLSKIMGNCVYPVRDYIRNEIIRAMGEIVLKDINEVLGTATNGGGVASACLSVDKAVPAMITKEHYLKLREWLNHTQEYEYLRQEYEELRQEYEELRQEYEELRYTFNNQKIHHAVWNYEIEGKEGHATPKPVELIKSIILHSSNEGDIILDPFCGSGKTLRACRETNRNCIGIEKDMVNVDLIEKIAMTKTPTLDAWNSQVSTDA